MNRLLGHRVAVHVGVQLAREAPVGLLDVVVARIARRRRAPRTGRARPPSTDRSPWRAPTGAWPRLAPRPSPTGSPCGSDRRRRSCRSSSRPVLNGAVMSEASHSPVEGCSAPIVTFSSRCRGADVGEHAEHLLLALEGLEQPAQRVAAHLLRLAGEVRHAAHHHVGRTLALGRDPQRLHRVQQQVALAVAALGRELQQPRLGVEVVEAAQALQSTVGVAQRRRVDARRACRSPACRRVRAGRPPGSSGSAPCRSARRARSAPRPRSAAPRAPRTA